MNNSNPSMNPIGGEQIWRADIEPALDSLMARAWRRVKTNKGASGSDGMTLAEYPDYIEAHWEEMLQTLKDGN